MLKEKLCLIKKEFNKHKIDFEKLLGFEKKVHDLCEEELKGFKKKEAKVVCLYILNIDINMLLDDKIELPKKLEFQQKTHKYRQLNKYLTSKYDLTLGRAIAISKKKANAYLEGLQIPDKKYLLDISEFFFLEGKYLLDDSIELPEDEELKVDEDLVAILSKDKDESFFKNHHYIRKSYRLLGKNKRTMLVLTSLLFALPLVGYTFYSMYTVLSDRFETIHKYETGDKNLENSISINKEEASKDDSVQVKIGSEVSRISSIEPSKSNYQVHLKLWFDFDVNEFHDMFYQRYYDYRDPSLDAASGIDLSQDKYVYHQSTGTFSLGESINGKIVGDGIPDYIQIKNPNEADVTKLELTSLFLEEISFYPGERGHQYGDKENLFTLGNGDFTADTFENNEKIWYKDKDGNYRHFQAVTFVGDIHKSFDNPRYPLDSVQFHIYIQPTLYSNDLVRYMPNETIEVYDLSGSNVINTYKSGLSNFFGISSGYKVIDSDKVKGFNEGINNYQIEDNKYLGQYEIVIRANRQGISLFLQAFVNLFSVAIWIVIGFYNQAHSGSDSLGMMGTGLFGAISSMLVGLSMVSDAGMFSLITMLNIFTLGVILIMTYLSISANRANYKKDKLAIAYNGIRLRIMFVTLVVCTVLMFVGLPLGAYIFGF